METIEKISKEENPNKIIDKDKTFNKLKEIQALLKKESSLNELCKFILIFKFIYSHSRKR
jgi:hypothetical protein